MIRLNKYRLEIMFFWYGLVRYNIHKQISIKNNILLVRISQKKCLQTNID